MDANELMRTGIDCAVCSSPLQLMNMINLATGTLDGTKIDLYILDHAPQNETYYEALKSSGIFRKVSYLHSKLMTGGNSPYPWLRYLKASSYFLFPGKLLGQIDKGARYDRFFLASPDVPSQLLYYTFKKSNPAIELYMFEEGTFAYNFFEHRFGRVKRTFLKLLYHTDLYEDYKGAYVYHKELLNNVKQLPITTIAPMSKENKTLVSFFNRLSGYDVSMHPPVENEVIFLDQPYMFDAINQQQYSLYSRIEEKLGARLNVKLHPRTQKHPYRKVLKFQVSSEIMELNESFQDKVLISVFSTACLSPKMMFDEEPIVILLYRLVDLSLMTNINENTFEIAKQIQAMYRDPSRFKIPETLEELDAILTSLL